MLGRINYSLSKKDSTGNKCSHFYVMPVSWSQIMNWNKYNSENTYKVSKIWYLWELSSRLNRSFLPPVARSVWTCYVVSSILNMIFPYFCSLVDIFVAQSTWSCSLIKYSFYSTWTSQSVGCKLDTACYLEFYTKGSIQFQKWWAIPISGIAYFWCGIDKLELIPCLHQGSIYVYYSNHSHMCAYKTCNKDFCFEFSVLLPHLGRLEKVQRRHLVRFFSK